MSQIFTIVTRELQTNRVTTEEEMLEGDSIKEQRYILTFYVNDEVTSEVNSVRASKVYKIGVPPEALDEAEDNRWHSLIYSVLLQKLKMLKDDEELVIAEQTFVDGCDTEKITVKLLLPTN